ncbi:MAG TPA: hypothetical protein VFM88_10145 [Vicinamibacteria bacterium]|nr:hypothetical protein [Vicinamibacteria bacterium]
MAESLVREETPLEFFRERLGRALEHQRVSTSAFTEFYLVNLLSAAVRGDLVPGPEPGFDETPLALLYARAMEAARHERARLLRLLGDSALFVSGFFAESLDRKLADAAYYRTLGGRAYARLSSEETLPFGPNVFGELGERFGQFADVLSEVSEATRLSRPVALLKLYERWVVTRSRRAALLLVEQGINPQTPAAVERPC